MNKLRGQQQRLKETRIAWDRVISENEFNNIKYIFKYNYDEIVVKDGVMVACVSI